MLPSVTCEDTTTVQEDTYHELVASISVEVMVLQTVV